MSGKRVLGILGMAVIAALGFAGGALAQPIVGVPHDWQTKRLWRLPGRATGA